MTAPSHPAGSTPAEPVNAAQPSEVRSYVKRLLLTILVGIITMTAAAVWAWNTYGSRLDSAPPLPSGIPPMSTVPATSR